VRINEPTRRATPGTGVNGWLFVALGALVLLLAALVCLAVYDSSRKDDIARGISVGGVEVGGLTAAEARTRLDNQLVQPLRRGVVVEWRGQSFQLTGERAGIDADIPGMVRKALARSREGTFLGRGLRDLFGGDVEAADIRARISYSKAAVAALVRQVKRALDRPARDARIDPSPSALTRMPGRRGRAVQSGVLQKKIVSALLRRGEVGVVHPTFVVTQPKVTTAQLASKYPWYITIDRASFRLRLFRRLELVETYPIAVRQAGYESPPGLHQILDKQVNPAWNVPDKPWAGSLAGSVVPPGDPQNPLKARWMAYALGGYGIHGTEEEWSIGRRASRGCIRMRVTDVTELYDRVPLKTPVYLGG
jgi:lipoprotein-anchoring transpeptidase ErfK/SrfK